MSMAPVILLVVNIKNFKKPMSRKGEYFYIDDDSTLLRNTFCCILTIDEEIHMPLTYFFYLSRLEQNDHFRFGGIFVTFSKLQIILFSILLLFTKTAPHLFICKQTKFFKGISCDSPLTRQIRIGNL